MIDLYCHHTEPNSLHLAARDLAGDIQKVLGERPTLKRHLPREEDGYILIGSITNSAFRAWVETRGLDVASLDGQWEGYRLQTFGDRHQNLLLCGSDERGAMWAVYEYAERHLGVDPMGYWTDHEPQRLLELPLGDVFVEDAPRAFRYRGWFLNDEDLLTEWKHGGGQRTIDYPYYQQVVHPDVLGRALETALRLKQNLIIPASFLDIDNPAEANLARMAVERGLFVTQHHIETLGVSHFALERYWKTRGCDTVPSFVTDRDKVVETWTYYARKWAALGDQVIWQLGLRGRGDRPVWQSDPNAPTGAAERGALISEAIATQRRIVAEVTGNPDAVCTTTLWDEGTDLFKAGHLHFPGDTIIVIADNLRATSHAYTIFAHQWAEDFYTVPRQPENRYGIYYHVAFWSTGPHLAQGVPLAKIAHAFHEACEKGDTTYTMTNVSNIRENVRGVCAISALGCQGAAFDAEAFQSRWCISQFGAAAADSVRELYTEMENAYHAVPAPGAAFPALLHDGAISSKTKSLLLYLEDWDVSARHGSCDDNVRCRAAFLQAATAESLGRWDALRKHIRDRQACIPADRQAFYTHHFAIQATLMDALTRWGHAVASFVVGFPSAPMALQSQRLTEAADALDEALRACRESEIGKWEHWYRGDRKLNFRELRAQTVSLREALLLNTNQG